MSAVFATTSTADTYSIDSFQNSLHWQWIQTNNYETDISLPVDCGTGPCSASTLISHFKELQRQSQYKNFLIPHRTTPDSIRLVTYNVHFWQLPDLKQYDPEQNAASEMIESLVKMQADIVMLQEVLFDPKVIAQLFNRLEVEGKRYFFCQEAHNYQGRFAIGNMTIFLSDFDIYSIKYHRYNPPLLQQERQENEKAKIESYEAEPDGNLRKKWRAEVPGRCSILSTVSRPGSSQKLQMTNVHLDHRRSGYHRMMHLLEVFRMMDRSAFVPAAKLIAGDFNSIDGTQLSSDYTREIIEDARKRNQKLALNELRLMAQYGFGDSFNSSCIKPPAVSVWSLTRIDYLFVGQDSTLCMKGQYVYYTPASDHAALLFDFELAQ